MALVLEALGIDRNDPEVLQTREDFNSFADLIGSLVRRRRALGLTQTEVAEAMGTKQSAISAIESSTANPTIQRLQRYARALGTRIVLEVEEPGAVPDEWQVVSCEGSQNLSEIRHMQVSSRIADAAGWTCWRGDNAA